MQGKDACPYRPYGTAFIHSQVPEGVVEASFAQNVHASKCNSFFRSAPVPRNHYISPRAPVSASGTSGYMYGSSARRRKKRALRPGKKRESNDSSLLPVSFWDGGNPPLPQPGKRERTTPKVIYPFPFACSAPPESASALPEMHAVYLLSMTVQQNCRHKRRCNQHCGNRENDINLTFYSPQPNGK